MNNNKFITPDELAERWRVSKSWIYRQTRERGPDAIPVVRVGKYLRFDERADEWLDRRNREQR